MNLQCPHSRGAHTRRQIAEAQKNKQTILAGEGRQQRTHDANPNPDAGDLRGDPNSGAENGQGRSLPGRRRPQARPAAGPAVPGARRRRCRRPGVAGVLAARKRGGAVAGLPGGGRLRLQPGGGGLRLRRAALRRRRRPPVERHRPCFHRQRVTAGPEDPLPPRDGPGMAAKPWLDDKVVVFGPDMTAKP